MMYQKPKRKLVYFRPGQITFLATHPGDTVTDEDLRKWKDEVENFLQGGRIIWPPRTFSFRALTVDEDMPSKDQSERLTSAFKPSQQPPERLRDAFSIIACDVENVPDDPRELLKLIAELNKQLRNRVFAGLTMKAISPNWLSSAASEAGGTGGPGGWPVPFQGMPDRAPYDFRKLRDDLAAAGLKGDGENVDVAILDTAPCPHDLIAAHKEWKDRHPLIRTLLGPDGQLRLYPATYDELLRMRSTSLNRHDYKMTDHGLFAAGIVHTIAPRAKIHLIEVLNACGVGDLATLAGGLEKVFRDIYKPERRLVVNCSWMLELSLEDKHCYAESEADPEFEFEQDVLQFAQNDQDQAFALRAVCDRLEDAGRQVIAAAGNDWREKKARPDAPKARYPAGFISAIGVGALPRDSQPDPVTGKFAASNYSNLADKPPMTGIMTLGGEPGEGQGLLGLYLGGFPLCEENCTKWAWWAGTSFATPILTGAIAAVLSSPARLTTTKEAITALYDKKIILQYQTTAQEDALHTMQDYPTL